MQIPCGNSNVYCPEGSFQPHQVDIGYYTTGSLTFPTMDKQDANDAQFRSSQIICEPGYYCVNGVKLPCPIGRYGDTFGLTSSDCR